MTTEEAIQEQAEIYAERMRNLQGGKGGKKLWAGVFDGEDVDDCQLEEEAANLIAHAVHESSSRTFYRAMSYGAFDDLPALSSAYALLCVEIGFRLGQTALEPDNDDV